ncbi:MAG: hypothetical protein ACFFD4_19780 [Candidatus Odinarchaeota archaeon]
MDNNLPPLGSFFGLTHIKPSRPISLGSQSLDTPFPQELFILWSGGLDSTAYLIHLLETTPVTIHPFHFQLHGGGRCAQEWKTINNVLYPSLAKSFPGRIIPPVQLKRYLSKEEKLFRNLHLINHLKNLYPSIQQVALGIIGSDSSEELLFEVKYDLLDSTPSFLSSRSRIIIRSPVELAWTTKADLLFYFQSKHLEFVPLLQKTRSCQVWFKKPCGQCHSCLERAIAFNLVFAVEIKRDDYQREPPLKSKNYQAFYDRICGEVEGSAFKTVELSRILVHSPLR